MNIQKLLQPLTSLQGRETITPDEHIEALNSILEASVWLDNMAVAPDEPEGASDTQDAPDPNGDRWANLRNLSAKQIAKLGNKQDTIAIAQQMGIEVKSRDTEKAISEKIEAWLKEN